MLKICSKYFLYLFFVFSMNLEGSFFQKHDPYYLMGQGVVKGGLDEINNQVTNASGENIGHFFHKVVSGGIGGIGSGMEDGEQDIAKSINGFFGGCGKGLEVAFEKGGKFDVGLDNFINVNNKFFKKVILNNYEKFAYVGFIALTGGYIAQYGIPLIMKMIECQLMKPKLIISSSKKSFYELVFGKNITLHPMIFTPQLEKRLDNLTQITSTIQKKIKQGKTNIKYRNLMLYGPPGTGKTLFATELAKRSGLEYACMSGSSFSKFKDGEGIEALDELFAWANKSNGLLIFIDEADTFLSDRNNMNPQSKEYQILNNFLNYTGQRSDKFMFVFATNHKESLDSAMYRRIDDLIKIPLPGRAERIKMLHLYKDIILLDEKNNDNNFIVSVHKVLTDDVILYIADQTKGLSGGDLEGIINAIKTDSDILDPSILTLELVQNVVENAIEKHETFTKGIMLDFVED